MTRHRFVVLGMLSFASAWALFVSTHPSLTRFSHPWRYTAKAVRVPAAARALRPNYPYSVVPGGIYSPEELAKISRKDRVVRDHYDDFDIAFAKLVRTTEDQFQYVSYRMGNDIFWTSRKLRIPKGEVLLTDGTHFCRTRCGNRLSTKPHKETTAMEPAEHILNLPPFRPEMLATKEVELSPPPPLDEIALAAPDLPYDAPRLAPLFPAGSEEAMLAKPAWPAANAMLLPPALVESAAAIYIPPTQTSSGGQPPPNPVPGGAGVPIIEDAPEPTTLALSLLTLFTAACLSVFRRRKDRSLKADETPPQLSRAR